MAKLFLGLAIAVMLATAVLALLSKGNIDKLQSEFKGTKTQLGTTQNNLRKTEGELKKTQEDLTAANGKVEQQTTEINGLKQERDGLNTRITTMQSELTTANTELASLKEKLKGDPNKPPVNIDEMVAQIEQQKNDLNKAQAELAESKAMVDTLTTQSRQKDEQLASAQSEVKRYQSGVSRQGLTGRVLAVNPGWNFVVLSVGDRQGAATGSNMIVTRGGEVIGKARITSVEPSTSIADILPGTFRRGVSVQPGDTVVYEGSRGKPNTLAAPAPGAQAPLPQP